jgi:hypothetical protein
MATGYNRPAPISWSYASATPLGQSEVFDLAFANKALHCAGHVLDWRVGIDAVLVEEIDDVDAEPLHRSLDDFSNVLGSTVQAGPDFLAGGVEVETELGGDDESHTARSRITLMRSDLASKPMPGSSGILM